MATPTRIRKPDDLLGEKDVALNELLRLTDELLARTRNVLVERKNDIQHSRGDIQQHKYEAGRLLAELGQIERMVQLATSLRIIAKHENNIWENVREINDTYYELLEEIPGALPGTFAPHAPSQPLWSSDSTSPSTSVSPELEPMLPRKRKLREDSDEERDVEPKKRRRLAVDSPSLGGPLTTTRLASRSPIALSPHLLRHTVSPSLYPISRTVSPSQGHCQAPFLPLRSLSPNEPPRHAPPTDESPVATPQLLPGLTSPLYQPQSPSLSEIIRGAGSPRPLTALDTP